MTDPIPMVLNPHGRLDAAHTPAFEQELREQLDSGHVHLLVDLGDTTYISSNGLRALLAAHKSAQRAGGALRLCGLNARLTEIFEMVGFDQVFEIYADCATAQASFSA